VLKFATRGVKSCSEKVCFKVPLKTLNVSDERSESGREFQIVEAAARKEREPTIRFVRDTCKMFEEEDDLRTREEW